MWGPFGERVPRADAPRGGRPVQGGQSRRPIKGSESLKDDGAERHFPADSTPMIGAQALESSATSFMGGAGRCESARTGPPSNDSDHLKSPSAGAATVRGSAADSAA